MAARLEIMSLSKSLQQQLKHDTPYAWFLRDQASVSPVFYRKHLAELDERLEAYLDCYLVSQRAGESLLPILDMSDWGAVFVTALTAIRTNDTESFELALNALEEESQAKELSDAFCWTSFEQSKSFLDKAILDKNPLARIAGITAVAYFTPQISPELLDTFLKDKSLGVIAATIKVIGENKLNDYDEKLWEFLTHEDEEIRFRAAFSGNLIGVQGAYEALQKFCFGDETPYLREALSLLYQVMPEGDISNTLARIQKSSLSVRIKAYSIAMAGLPDMVPVLLEWMEDPEYAPLAGEAFSFITGADIEEDDLSILDVEICESQEAPLAEKRKSDPWTEAYEDDLPWPDPELTGNWWKAHQQHFQNGTRYLAGKTLEENNLQAVLKNGTQPQRHIANLILSIQDPSRVIKTVQLL
ncbi:MAG: TIGR02270 family protein [Cocleimonas sp.]|nr:TIGR02270 family protein [Cocleimonas sp.]